jgi:hypothetical protein
MILLVQAQHCLLGARRFNEPVERSAITIPPRLAVSEGDGSNDHHLLARRVPGFLLFVSGIVREGAVV